MSNAIAPAQADSSGINHINACLIHVIAVLFYKRLPQNHNMDYQPVCTEVGEDPGESAHALERPTKHYMLHTKLKVV